MKKVWQLANKCKNINVNTMMIALMVNSVGMAINCHRKLLPEKIA